MEETRPELQEIEPGYQFKASGGGDYVKLPEKKLLKAYVDSIKMTSQVDEFKTLPDGKPNPNYGKDKTVLVFGFKVDEPELEGNGQVYTRWVSEAVSERSNLGKISDALLGSWNAILEVEEVKHLYGLPLQIVLIPGKKNPDRQTVDIDKLMPADPSQAKTEPTKADVEVSAEEFEALASGDGKAAAALEAALETGKTVS